MTSKEKTIIGISVPAALLCAVFGAKECSRPIERCVVALQTRGKAEQAVKSALELYPSAKAEPCEMGPVMGEDDRFPFWGAKDAVYQCGEVPVRCSKVPKDYPRHAGDYLCFFYDKDEWKMANRNFRQWKKSNP